MVGLLSAVGLIALSAVGMATLSVRSALVSGFVAALAVPAPFLVPEDWPFLRTFLAIFSLVPVFKHLELVTDSRPRSMAFRILHTASIFDLRKATWTSPVFSLPILTNAMAHLVLFGVGLFWAGVGRELGAPGFVFEVLGGILAVAGLVEGIADLLRFLYALFGVAAPPVMRRPLLARGILDFWGRRWNTTVSGWLNRYFFRPFARRGHPSLGLVASFGFSGLFHAWVAYPALGASGALLMGSFFWAQIPGAWVERRITVNWRPRARRAFATFALLATSPLFIVPFNRILLG